MKLPRALSPPSLLLLAALASGCRRDANAAPAAPAEPRLKVTTTIIGERAVPKLVELTGTLAPELRTDLSANATGRVTRTLVERGQRVQKGQLLVLLDVRSATLNASAAAADARSSAASLEFSRADCVRYDALLAKGAVTQQEHDRVASQCRAQAAAEQAARARAGEAAQPIVDGAIRAPFAGVIAERFVAVGDYVRPESRVVTLLVDNPLRLALSIPEPDISAVHPGLSLQFESVARPGQRFSASVRYIGQEVRATTRDLVVEAIVDNKDGALLPGMFVTAELPAGEELLPVVPRSALTPLNGAESSVFVLESGRLEQHVVQLGLPSGDDVSVLDGLKKGARVVVPPPDRTADGTLAEEGLVMQWLAEICIRRPIFTWVLMLVVVVVGLVGYSSLGLDQFPKVDFPTVIVTTRLDGAAPEEVETELSDKIEGAVNTISGIDQLRSTSSEGVSQVIVTFTLSKNPDVAAQEVRDHINNILPDLPKGIDQPVVSKVDPDASPVLFITVAGPGTVREITELADKRVKRQIESISGVGQVTLVGGRKRQINVWLDAIKLQASGLTAFDVERAIGAQNLSVPGGEIETGPSRLTLRVEGKVATAAAVGRIVVHDTRDHPTRVEDVARVEDGAEQEDTWASEDGKQTVVLSVRKQSGENTVAVVDAVRARLVELQKALPSGAKLAVVRDNSAIVRTMVDAVKEHLVLGALLAALIVLLFLGNVRSTLIAALAIPISIVGTFALMWAMGFTLNIITLLALALAVGIVIDDAIVVLENVVRFIEVKRQKPFPAAVLATRDIGLAVLATTLSLLAVFLPVSFMGGIMGQFLKSFGVTMAFAIAVSLLVSFSLTPMLAARWLAGPAAERLSGEKPLLERFVLSFYGPIERAYLAVLRAVMRRRWIVVVLSALTLGSYAPLLKAVPKGFIPENDAAEFEINVRAPEGTSLLSTRLIAERIAAETRALPGVGHTLLTIGNNDLKTQNLANIYVKLVDPKDRADDQAAMIDRARREVVAHQPKDLRIDVSEVAAFSTGDSSAAVQYTLSGPDLGRLQGYTDRVLQDLRKTPAAVDVDSSLILGKPEVDLRIQRERAGDLNVDVSDVATALQLLIGGVKVSTLQDGGEDYDIRVRAQPGDRSDARRLSVLTVPSRTAGSVPLASVVDIRPGTGPSQINRLSRQRQVTITSNVAPGFGQSDVQAALEKSIAALHLPPDYHAMPAGMTREMGKAGQSFLLALLISFVFMYLVLAAQFESWLHPITILLSLPLTIPFALLSLLLFHQALTMLSALGILVLFGVVKKNAILQVDHTNHLRAEGMARDEAILEANRDRLRPILMTTAAFVAGMAPLMLSRGIGAGFNRATAGVVLGGQSLSLLLTLLATPVAYSFFDDLSVWIKSKRTPRAFEDRGFDQLDHLGEEALPPSPAE